MGGRGRLGGLSWGGGCRRRDTGGTGHLGEVEGGLGCSHGVGGGEGGLGVTAVGGVEMVDLRLGDKGLALWRLSGPKQRLGRGRTVREAQRRLGCTPLVRHV